MKLQRHSYIDYLHFLCMGSDSMCFLHGHVIILLLSTTVNWYILYIIFVLGLIVKQIMLLTAMTVLVYFLLLELFLYMCINPLWTCFSWVFFFSGPHFHSCEERRALYSWCQLSLQVQEYSCWYQSGHWIKR